MLSEPRLLTFNIPDPASGSAHIIVCYEWGDVSAPPLLCVHGLTRNGRDFDMLAQALAGHYWVLCPDMPGRGKSRWLSDPKGYNNSAYIGDILFLLNALEITYVDWIGTSMGGILGMMMANAKPGLIGRLVLNDVGCFIPATGAQRIFDIADMKTAYATYAEAEAAFRKRCAGFGITDESQWSHLLRYGIEQKKDGLFHFTYDPAIFSSTKGQKAAEINLWPLWEAVKMPVLLLRGVASDLLSRETAIEMQSRHPDLTLEEIANTGHAPALMDDKQIALIQHWLSAKKLL